MTLHAVTKRNVNTLTFGCGLPISPQGKHAVDLRRLEAKEHSVNISSQGRYYFHVIHLLIVWQKMED